MKRVRVKPSKPNSLLSMIVGIVFVVIGVTTVIPNAGLFGIFWTLAALAIAAFHGYNWFSNKGSSLYDIEVEQDGSSSDFDEKLRKLKKLYDDGIITRDEYETKKNEILQSKW